eukprot:gene7837-10644_t
MLNNQNSKWKAGRVLQGTSGWSDDSIATCGKFYPRKNMTTLERLSFYSKSGLFSCVEVDFSTYSLITEERVASWLEVTPAKFLFHFKAYGCLVNNGIEISNLPKDIRAGLMKDRGITEKSNKYMSLRELGEKIEKEIWKRFNSAILIAARHEKLGVIVFQFQLNITPCLLNRQYIERCAQNLDQTVIMAVEFRNRSWLDENHLEDTIIWLKSLRKVSGGICLICADDLIHEVYQKDSDQRGLKPGERAKQFPIILTNRSCPSVVYIRLHRRFGNERIISNLEINDWAHRLSCLVNNNNDSNNEIMSGPIYFLWGTDHEDQPIMNARNLYNALPQQLKLNWMDFILEVSKKTVNKLFFNPRSLVNNDDKLNLKQNGSNYQSDDKNEDNNKIDNLNVVSGDDGVKSSDDVLNDVVIIDQTDNNNNNNNNNNFQSNQSYSISNSNSNYKSGNDFNNNNNNNNKSYNNNNNNKSYNNNKLTAVAMESDMIHNLKKRKMEPTKITPIKQVNILSYFKKAPET